jgi:4-carboxymuconolactone decarboxylase
MSDHTTIDHRERRDRGLALYREIMCAEPPALTTPRAATLIDFVFAEIWSRPGLERRARRLIAIACAAGIGADDTLAAHVYGALASGDLTYEEMNEAVLHHAVYCGWPNAEAFERIVEQQWARLHRERGTTPPPAAEQPLTHVSPVQEQRKLDGEEEFRIVNCVQAPPRGIPYYDDGILNFVFGDMWQRRGISRRDRRFLTLAQVGFDDTHVPVMSHVYSALKSRDVSIDQMREVVLQFAAHSGWPKGSFLQQMVDQQWARILEEEAAG